LAALLWITAVIIIQRPNAAAKVWLFLLPLMLLWAAAGTVGLLEKARLKFLRGLPLAVILVGLALLAETQHAAWLAPQLPEIWAGHGGEEKAVLFVKGQLQDNDLIIVAPPDDAAVWYYSDLYGIMNTHFDLTLAFDRALVLVDPFQGQTPASVLEARGPYPAQVEVESCRLLDTFDKILVFECTRK